MYHMGATIRVDEDDPRSEKIWASLMDVACRSFGLCAGAGCSCVVGVGRRLCHEVCHGERLKVASSEGPTWLTIAWKLPSSINFDFYFDEDVPPNWDNRRALSEALNGYELPILWRQTTDNYSREKIG